MTAPSPGLALAARLFAELHAASADPPGVTRDAYGPGEDAAHALVRAEGVALGLSPSVDHAGNLYLTLPGRDRSLPRHVVGSHLDSVRHGGDYDGTAGVLGGLAALADLAAEGWRPRADAVLMVTRAEESGSWFPCSFPGSRAALGMLPPAALGTRRPDTGRTLAEHMRDRGFDPDACAAGRAVLDRSNVAAFLELHIEQGPVLDHAGIPVGVVTAIPGARRYRQATVRGETNHSGATPREFRRDAAIAAAEIACRLDGAWAELAAAGHALVCTFCVLRTGEEAGFTRIAGTASFELDMRGTDAAGLDLLQARLDGIVAGVAARRRVDVALGPLTRTEPVAMSGPMRLALAAAARRAGVPCRAMASGGGHDAGAFAQAGIPAGLLFVRNQNGSHHAGEAMRPADFADAVRVASAWLRRADADAAGGHAVRARPRRGRNLHGASDQTARPRTPPGCP